MNRREALKAAGGIIVAGKTSALGFDFKPRPEYVVFFDLKIMDRGFSEEERAAFPPNTLFYPVDVPPGQTLDDAIRIFHLQDGAIP